MKKFFFSDVFQAKNKSKKENCVRTRLNKKKTLFSNEQKDILRSLILSGFVLVGLRRKRGGKVKKRYSIQLILGHVFRDSKKEEDAGSEVEN